jgi:23S rRNA (guanosine2251-2'-O)-methyltransferase
VIDSQAGDGSWVVGRRAVEEALRDGDIPERIWVAEDPACRAWWSRGPATLAQAAHVPVLFVPRAALDRLVAGQAVHQGVVARAAAVLLCDLEELVDGAAGTLLVLVDGIEDPRNLGAVIRSAAGAGATGVLLPERRVAGLGPACAKAAAGALRRVPLARVKSVQRALERLSRAGIWTVGLAAGARPVWETDFVRPTCLVIGGEERGLSRLARERCDDLAGIPMASGLDSLNASVAASVALFEAVRQRGRAPERP